mgnify:CR=1 FL=1
MSNLSSLIDEAPTFKELLWAIMDEKRNNIVNTELYKFLEKRIRERCEEGARKLRGSINLIELDLHSSDALFKHMSSGMSSSVILDTIKCICNKLELEFDVDIISWGRTSVSPKEDIHD